MRYSIVIQKINQLPHIVTDTEIQEATSAAATVELDTVEKVLTVAKALLSVRRSANPQIHFLIDFEERNVRRFYFDPQGALTLANPEESGNQLGYATDWQYFEPDAVVPMSVEPSREELIVEAADTVIAAAETVKESAVTGTLPPKRTKADRVKERKEKKNR